MQISDLICYGQAAGTIVRGRAGFEHPAL